MEYNTTRSKLLMPEYGRNVQRMVEYLMTLEDRDQRRRNAEAIIELMGTLNPHLKTIEDYKHKLWDHLVQMTDFKLDVDAPYPPPTPEELYKKPEPLPYPQSSIRHRHMGKNLEALIEKALAEKDPSNNNSSSRVVAATADTKAAEIKAIAVVVEITVAEIATTRIVSLRIKINNLHYGCI